MAFKTNLKKIREENKLSQEQLSDILHIDRTTYNHYENNYNTIPIKHLIKICDYFQVGIDYVFCFKKNNSNKTFNKSNLKTTALRLKEFRKENNLTQAKLATKLKTNQSVIAGYEHERNFIATPFLYMICSKYNISSDYLLGRIDNPKYLK